MAKKLKWGVGDRKELIAQMKKGVPEQEIRSSMGNMTSVQFAAQLKKAMVEGGQLKQAKGKQAKEKANTYEVTKKGRLTLSDFGSVSGFQAGAKFTLKKPHGKSKAWRVLPA